MSVHKEWDQNNHPNTITTGLFIISEATEDVIFTNIIRSTRELETYELEIQARVHGLSLSSPSGLNTAQLAAQVIKQEPSQGNQATIEPPRLPSMPQAVGPSMDLGLDLGLGLSDQPLAFDSMTDMPFPLKLDSGLGNILLDDLLSPVGTTDPLLSSVSPGVSKGSSRRSSFSMEDEPGC
ncbi:microphthalmia-associated transcription factor-like [Chiloscyllium plagiosum]|uniref:microphthalmia-associated transcription factor-like n=1 Tax=Chiloscyllium plagiosum TaxID=36176 RepID=UPI001CB7AF04|nr:microphthalmia-associated transcription factor-like [Chiloscyllium plagiosum]